MFAAVIDYDLADLELMYVFIEWNNPNDATTISEFKAAVNVVLPGATFSNFVTTTSASSSGPNITKILNKTFDTIIAVTMFLCFFALSANMSANLYEQTKEIGVLRAIGFTKCRIKMLYFYEAMVLVFASSILGVMVGMIVGYTMTLQEKLILSSSLAFFFPWNQFIVVMVLSLLCAFFSTFGPTTQLTSKQIAAIFRLV
jgi:ABC-type antimicrobial peptide transport system permease subunit